MRHINADDIKEKVKELFLKSNYYIGADILNSLEEGVLKEESPTGKAVLEQIIKNHEIASIEQIAICQDTGMAVLFIELGQNVSVDFTGQIIYYVGPAPAKPEYSSGAAGPTTSYRMDKNTPPLLERGLKGMIGKGLRSQTVTESIKKNNAVYFAATGGAAALIAKSIKKVEVIAYEDLGAEALHKMVVEDFPAIVVLDSEGNNLYESGPKQYEK